MFVADLHNDVLQRAYVGEDITKETKNGHSDLIRLHQSCIDLEVFVIWTPKDSENLNPFTKAKEFYEKLVLLEKNNNIKITTNLAEIEESKKNNVLAIPFSIEGGEFINNKIENLHYFIEKGLFYFGPTWNNSLDWVSSNYDEKHNRKNIKFFGISKFGEEIINICIENSVIIDVSHLGEKSFWDLEKISSQPILASHSSVYNICPHHRNLKDEQIIAIKNSEGLIGLNPYPYFIDKDFALKEKKFRESFINELNEKFLLSNKSISNWLDKQHFLQKKLNAITPSIDVFIDHIEYIINLIGIDYVGIGSDYDGLDCLPKEMNDCKDHIKIIERLDSRGYKQNEIEKIMGLNLLRLVESIKG